MPDIIYPFYDLQLVEGAAVWADGECDINYDHCTFAVGEIRLSPEVRKAGGSPVIVSPQHPLFPSLYKAIRRQADDIWAQIGEATEDLAASYGDTRADHLNDMARE